LKALKSEKTMLDVNLSCVCLYHFKRITGHLVET